jgi:parallel beta-helix repeat protein
MKLVTNKMAISSANFLPASLNEVSATSSVSYVVFTDGSRYYAKKSDTGQAEYSDADASNVIQYAINNAPAYSSVVIRSGIYLLTKGIVINKSITLIGEGFPTLKIKPNMNMDAISVWADDVVVTGIRIDGSGTESKIGVQNGIAVGDIDKPVRRVLVINNIIENIRYSRGIYKGILASYGYGVNIIKGSNNIIAFNKFRNVMHWNILVHPINWNINPAGATMNVIIGNVGYDGLEGVTILTTDNIIIGNSFYNQGRYGIILESGGRNTVVGNVLAYCGSSGSHDGKGGNGIRIMTSDNVVANNIVVFAYESGIAVTNNASRNIIEGNFVANSNYKGDTNRRWGNIEILDGATNNIIRNNKVYVGYYGYPRLNYGIRVLSNAASGNIIEDNDVRDGGYYGKVLIEATGQIIRRNIGYATENSGIATIPAGSTCITVNHDLAQTPKKVLVTPLSQVSSVWYVANINSESFQICLNQPQNVDVNFSWYTDIA